ncbi:hypothetical protein JXR93_05545 [bacterium]|nr:hypothetical protein [bacterium]
MKKTIFILFLITSTIFGDLIDDIKEFKKSLVRIENSPINSNFKNITDVNYKIPKDIKDFLLKNSKKIDNFIQFLIKIDTKDVISIPVSKEMIQVTSNIHYFRLALLMAHLKFENGDIKTAILYYQSIWKWIYLTRVEYSLVSEISAVSMEKTFFEYLENNYKKFSKNDIKIFYELLKTRESFKESIIKALKGEFDFFKLYNDELWSSLNEDFGSFIIKIAESEKTKEELKELFFKLINDDLDKKMNGLIDSYKTGGIDGVREFENSLEKEIIKTKEKTVIKTIFSIIFLTPKKNRVEHLFREILNILSAISTPKFSTYFEKVEDVERIYLNLLNKLETKK